MSGAAITLPQGGGALKGIGETFQPDLFHGTGRHTLPIAISPGRGGFGPALSLQYSSGNGNGAFGLGWQLSLPTVARKTERGIPRYRDTDVFVLAGAEDLVRTPEPPTQRPSHTVFRYRPRTEGLFARIERWEGDIAGETHWRAITKENVTNVYGASPASRIADPENAAHVSEWLLEETFDAAGNHIRYEYARDDPALYANPGSAAIADRHRNATQLYLRRIYYGNLPEPLDGRAALRYPDGTEVGHRRGGRRYAFEVLFDYGDTTTMPPHPEPAPDGQQELFGEARPVPVRPDCFSRYRSGFETRTLRRCRRVLMFHHFAELGHPTLVRATDFTYDTDPDTLVSLLTATTVTGYRDDGAGGYHSAGLPPVTFTYATFRPQEQRYRSIVARGNDMPPQALNHPDTALVDLFGDGLPDVLHSGPAGFRYWRNLGGGRLDRPRAMAQIPAGVALSTPGVGFGDLGGDGQADLLVHSGPTAGFFETTATGTWREFQPYPAAPAFALDDPNVRLLDLTGNGLSDALLTGDQHFLWFECLGERGFAEPRRIARRHDLATFPDVFFDDPARRVRLADMTGDGLQDIVLLHSGRIDYWPNLGYGRFGKRVTMADAPRLPRDFRPERLFLADLNGNGCADLVYVAFDQVQFWFNRCGNGWSPMQAVTGTPRTSDVDSVQFADFFGTGTATLLWSHDVGSPRGSTVKALDFCGGGKPYVLTEMSNGMGATTRVRYAPSTAYAVADQADAAPWATRLPFPVQVVDTVEVIDHIGGTRLVTSYRYHHGHFDGSEREFRGFARVDQFDTESFGEPTGAEFHVPPVETRTWFHTGAVPAGQELRREFYRDPDAPPMAEHDVETGTSPREAYRALRGAVLRTEVYARDGTARAEHPHQVVDNRYRVQQLQPSTAAQHGVYLQSRVESVSHHYERTPADPRISHALTLQIDAFGNALRSVAVNYGRRQPDPMLPTPADRDRQTRTFVTYTENGYTNAVDEPDHHRAPLPSEARTYELTGFAPAGGRPRFDVAEWAADDFALLGSAADIGYPETADPATPQRRLIEHVRTRYRRDDLGALLPFGVLEHLALPGESYRLALTPEIIAATYGDRVTDAVLAQEGGYVHVDGDVDWWVPSGRVFYSADEADAPEVELAVARRHFFLTHRSRDPFGHTASLRHDRYDLFVEQTTDALGNTTGAEHDYRVLQPFRVTDANGNRTEVGFDTLGLVVGTALMGKVDEAAGDALAGPAADLTEQQLQDFLADPLGTAAAVLGPATTRVVYDFSQYGRAQQPVFAAVLARETHAAAGARIQVTFGYSDGFGREIQQKARAEPARWVSRGWTVFNNKGKPVRQYEPFFSADHRFERGVQVGVSPTLFYDPLERVVATLHPDHTWEKVHLEPWRQEAWDVSDTVLVADPATDADVGPFFARLPAGDYLPTWHAQRQSAGADAQERRAAAKAAGHADTPTHAFFDALGRPFLTITHNRVVCPGHELDGTEERFHARVERDVEGNTRVVRDPEEAGDPLGRIVMRYAYDMLGHRIHQRSMEAGARWMLDDVAGKPLRAWDGRGHAFTTSYDALRRPVGQVVRGTGPDADPRTLDRDLLVDEIQYGEPGPAATEAEEARARRLNLRTRIYRHRDSAGVVTNARLAADGDPTAAYDFKGNLLHTTRQLVSDHSAIPDWLSDPRLAAETFEVSTRYDALNRPVQSVAPHSSAGAGRTVVQNVFNEANLLERVDVWLDRAAEPADLIDPVGEPPSPVGVTGIDYDAKGRRLQIDYHNGVRTSYAYDPLTFRLAQVRTQRDPADFPGDDPQNVQNLVYTYDPSGNITHVRDDAQQAVFFRNQRVEPSNDYTYDARYRLIQADGREHLGQLGPTAPDGFDASTTRLDHPGDGNAMATYTERYTYDAVGNIRRIQHRGLDPAHPGWTRAYEYAEASLIGVGDNNRLTATTVHPTGADPLVEPYLHDVHGNVVRMPHLGSGAPGPNMEWDFKDQLRRVDLGGGGTAHYVYDAGGQRVRKVWEKAPGRIEERIYVGGFEVFRTHRGPIGPGSAILERETLHVMDDKQRIAMVETRTLDTAGADPAPPRLVRYQVGSQLGSTALELDERGQILSYEEYAPYGSTTYQAVRSRTETAKRYRYTAKERDEETGFGYHGARYYASWLGRWVSCDPVSLAGGPNLYQYADGDPVNLSDTRGTNPNRATPPANTPPDRPNGVGNVAPYNEQPAAAYQGGRRVTENEHGMPKKQLQDMTRNPSTNRPDYTDRHYANDTTYRSERSAALDKTHGNRGGPTADNPRSAHLERQRGAGQGVSYREDIFESRLTNAKRARDAVGSAVTDAEIHRAFLAQDGNLFALQRLDQSGAIVGSLGSTAEEFSIGTRASRLTPVLHTGRGVGVSGLAMAGRLVRLAGDVVMLGAAGYRAFMAGNHLREGDLGAAAMEGVYFLEDISPVPSARPARIGYPDITPDTQWVKDPDALFGRKSGCQVCHESVAVDNWLKTTRAGQTFESVNGSGITASGIATDQARKAWLEAGAHH